jgi:hypothetical protein
MQIHANRVTIGFVAAVAVFIAMDRYEPRFLNYVDAFFEGRLVVTIADNAGDDGWGGPSYSRYSAPIEKNTSTPGNLLTDESSGTYYDDCTCGAPDTNPDVTKPVTQGIKKHTGNINTKSPGKSASAEPYGHSDYSPNEGYTDVGSDTQPYGSADIYPNKFDYYDTATSAK